MKGRCAFGFLATLLFPSVLTARTALAYPELVRHGYVNCTSCHISPSGGGVLTEYGRQLSKDVLSTWGAEGEEAFAYKSVRPPEWLLMGGDYRSVYAYDNTPTVAEGQFVYMQGDLEAAAQYRSWVLDAALGYQDPAGARTALDHLISRRHYLMYRTEEGYSARAGRFKPAFGIYSPNHTWVTRRILDINQPTEETYNFELAYVGEAYNAYLTGIFGRPDSDEPSSKGAAVQLARALGDTYKVGLSYLYSTSDSRKRHAFGPFGILGFTSHFYLLAELDLQSDRDTVQADTRWGMAESQKLGYEVVQGLHLYLRQEFAKTDFRVEASSGRVYAAGLQFFPRPHFHFELEWQKQQGVDDPTTREFIDYAYFLVHFYL